MLVYASLVCIIRYTVGINIHQTMLQLKTKNVNIDQVKYKFIMSVCYLYCIQFIIIVHLRR